MAPHVRPAARRALARGRGLRRRRRRRRHGGEPTDGAAAECNADITVGVALDVGGLGDKSFNDAAKRGLDQAIADGLVCEENTNFVEANNTGSNRDANVEALADEGFDLIIGVGFAFSEGIAGIAADYPDQNFAIVDGFANAVDERRSRTSPTSRSRSTKVVPRRRRGRGGPVSATRSGSSAGRKALAASSRSSRPATRRACRR